MSLLYSSVLIGFRMDPVIPPDLRSAQEYHFPEEDANDIVTTLGYYKDESRFGVISVPIEEFEDYWYWMIESFLRTSNTTLGHLERLIPSNLLFIVLENLDLYSLVKFRQASLRAREVVGYMPYRKYQRVFEHASGLLRALFKSGRATEFSLFDVDKVLCTEACVVCGQFAGFISIPLWKRCCYVCLRIAPELRMQPRASAVRNFGLTRSQTKQLRQFPVLEGLYGIVDTSTPRTRKGLYTIVSAHQASTISGRPPPPTLTRNECLGIKFNYMACCPLPFYNRSSENPVAEPGFFCGGCYRANVDRKSFSSEDMIERLYTKDGLLRHFRWCRKAQIVWDLVKRGEPRPTFI